MRYDFETMLERRGMDAIAVDMIGKEGSFGPAGPQPGFDAIPMWVADMSFPTFPGITNALIERARHPAFGYFEPRKEYFDSICQWQLQRNRVTGLLPEHMLQKLGTDVGVAWQDGGMFGDPWGIRMNLALPFAKIREAFERLASHLGGTYGCF